MRTYLALFSLLMLLLLPIEGRGSEIYFPGGALEVTPSNSCTRTVNTGTNHVYTSMDCSNSGTQRFILHGEVNPDCGTTFTVSIFHQTAAASGNNVSWIVRNAACPSNLSGCNYDTVAPANNVSTTTLAVLGPNVMQESTFSSTETWYNANTSANCIGSACVSKPFVIQIDRDNSIGSNHASAIKVTGVRIVCP